MPRKKRQSKHPHDGASGKHSKHAKRAGAGPAEKGKKKVEDEETRAQNLLYLQEMFTGKLDCVLVHMIMEERNFNVEASLETLFSLVGDENPKPEYDPEARARDLFNYSASDSSNEDEEQQEEMGGVDSPDSAYSTVGLKSDASVDISATAGRIPFSLSGGGGVGLDDISLPPRVKGLDMAISMAGQLDRNYFPEETVERVTAGLKAYRSSGERDSLKNLEGVGAIAEMLLEAGAQEEDKEEARRQKEVAKPQKVKAKKIRSHLPVYSATDDQLVGRLSSSSGSDSESNTDEEAILSYAKIDNSVLLDEPMSHSKTDEEEQILKVEEAKGQTAAATKPGSKSSVDSGTLAGVHLNNSDAKKDNSVLLDEPTSHSKADEEEQILKMEEAKGQTAAAAKPGSKSSVDSGMLSGVHLNNSDADKLLATDPNAAALHPAGDQAGTIKGVIRTKEAGAVRPKGNVSFWNNLKAEEGEKCSSSDEDSEKDCDKDISFNEEVESDVLPTYGRDVSPHVHVHNGPIQHSKPKTNNSKGNSNRLAEHTCVRHPKYQHYVPRPIPYRHAPKGVIIREIDPNISNTQDLPMNSSPGVFQDKFSHPSNVPPGFQAGYERYNPRNLANGTTVHSRHPQTACPHAGHYVPGLRYGTTTYIMKNLTPGLLPRMGTQDIAHFSRKETCTYTNAKGQTAQAVRQVSMFQGYPRGPYTAATAAGIITHANPLNVAPDVRNIQEVPHRANGPLPNPNKLHRDIPESHPSEYHEVVTQEDTREVSASPKQWPQIRHTNVKRHQYPDMQRPREVPPLPPGKVLCLMRGCPGSGKSYLAKKLKSGGVVLTTDDYFMENGTYCFDRTKVGEAHEWNQNRAKEHLEKGTTPIIIDNTNVTSWEMKPYVAMALRHRYQVVFRESDAPWRHKAGELAERNSHGVPKVAIARMLQNFEHDVTVESIMNAPDKRKNAAHIAMLNEACGVKEDEGKGNVEGNNHGALNEEGEAGVDSVIAPAEPGWETVEKHRRHDGKENLHRSPQRGRGGRGGRRDLNHKNDLRGNSPKKFNNAIPGHNNQRRGADASDQKGNVESNESPTRYKHSPPSSDDSPPDFQKYKEKGMNGAEGLHQSGGAWMHSSPKRGRKNGHSPRRDNRRKNTDTQREAAVVPCHQPVCNAERSRTLDEAAEFLAKEGSLVPDPINRLRADIQSSGAKPKSNNLQHASKTVLNPATEGQNDTLRRDEALWKEELGQMKEGQSRHEVNRSQRLQGRRKENVLTKTNELETERPIGADNICTTVQTQQGSAPPRDNFARQSQEGNIVKENEDHLHKKIAEESSEPPGRIDAGDQLSDDKCDTQDMKGQDKVGNVNLDISPDASTSDMKALLESVMDTSEQSEWSQNPAVTDTPQLGELQEPLKAAADNERQSQAAIIDKKKDADGSQAEGLQTPIVFLPRGNSSTDDQDVSSSNCQSSVFPRTPTPSPRRPFRRSNSGSKSSRRIAAVFTSPEAASTSLMGTPGTDWAKNDPTISIPKPTFPERIEESVKEVHNFCEAGTITHAQDFAILQRVEAGTVDADGLPAGFTCKIAVVPPKGSILGAPSGDKPVELETSSRGTTSPIPISPRLHKGCMTEAIMEETNTEEEKVFMMKICFPNSSAEDLRDLLDTCGGDVQWATNLLLDSLSSVGAPAHAAGGIQNANSANGAGVSPTGGYQESDLSSTKGKAVELERSHQASVVDQTLQDDQPRRPRMSDDETRTTSEMGEQDVQGRKSDNSGSLPVIYGSKGNPATPNNANVISKLEGDSERFANELAQASNVFYSTNNTDKEKDGSEGACTEVEKFASLHSKDSPGKEEDKTYSGDDSSSDDCEEFSNNFLSGVTFSKSSSKIVSSRTPVEEELPPLESFEVESELMKRAIMENDTADKNEMKGSPQASDHRFAKTPAVQELSDGVKAETDVGSPAADADTQIGDPPKQDQKQDISPGHTVHQVAEAAVQPESRLEENVPLNISASQELGMNNSQAEDVDSKDDSKDCMAELYSSEHAPDQKREKKQEEDFPDINNHLEAQRENTKDENENCNVELPSHVEAQRSPSSLLKEPSPDTPVDATGQEAEKSSLSGTSLDDADIPWAAGFSNDSIAKGAMKGQQEEEEEEEKTTAEDALNQSGEGVYDYLGGMELQLDPAFVLQLQELFGSVGFHIQPDALSPADLKVKIGYRLAKELHQAWSSGLEERFQSKERQVEEMLQRDAELARRLQQEENLKKLAKSHRDNKKPGKFVAPGSPRNKKRQRDANGNGGGGGGGVDPVRAENLLVGGGLRALKELAGGTFPCPPPVQRQDVPELAKIMAEEEQRVKSEEEETWRNASPVRAGTIATKLKRDQLYEAFPDVDKNMLEDIFKANNYDLEHAMWEASAVFRDTPNTVKQVFTDEAWTKVQKRAQSPARVKACQESDERDGQYQSTEEPDYDDYRAEATLHYRMRDECFQKAAKAYHSKQKELAVHYSKQGHLHSMKLKEANRRAAEAILVQRKHKTGENKLDLHNLHVEEALQALQEVLIEKEQQRWQGGRGTTPNGGQQRYLEVVTGRGRHSQGGVAKLKPAVAKFLEQRGYRYTSPNAGCLRVYLS